MKEKAFLFVVNAHHFVDKEVNSINSASDLLNKWFWLDDSVFI